MLVKKASGRKWTSKVGPERLPHPLLLTRFSHLEAGAARPRVATLPVGLYEKALPEPWSWDKRLTAAAAAGYDFVEISIDES